MPVNIKYYSIYGCRYVGKITYYFRNNLTWETGEFSSFGKIIFYN